MQVTRTAFTGAALGGDAEFELKIVKRGPQARHLGDVAVRDALANTNDHAWIVN
jgi:hypothetical protein